LKQKKITQQSANQAGPSTSPQIAAAVANTQQFFLSAQIAATQQTSGPIPHPEILRQYEQLSPGLTSRIVKMAEDEAAHRRAMEAEAIAIQGRDQIHYRILEALGQIFGLTIGISAIGGSVYMGVHGAEWPASLLGTGGVTALVTAFIAGRKTLLKQKDQEFAQQLAAIQEQHRQQIESLKLQRQ